MTIVETKDLIYQSKISDFSNNPKKINKKCKKNVN